MALLRRLIGEQRAATLANPPGWLIQALTGGASYSGKTVSVDNVLGLVPYWRGVNILANAFATAPFIVYRGEGAQRERARDSRTWELLHDTPNSRMAADEFWALAESHVETWGNFFAYKQRAGDGRIAQLWPLRPERVQVGTREDGSVFYVVDGQLDNPLTDLNILHIRGLSKDGVLGWSPIRKARQELGTALARQEFAGKFWANDATPGLVLLHPQALKRDAVERIKALWKDSHQGVGKAREPAVLGEDMKLQQLTMPLDDAQFVEQAKLGRTDIALILGLPPYMLAGESGGDSLTYSTTEGHALDLLKWTVGPRFVRFQNAVNRDPELMPEGLKGEFLADAILRATQSERYRAWSQAPHLTIDELREMDNRPPLPNGAGQGLVNAASVPSEGNQ